MRKATYVGFAKFKKWVDCFNGSFSVSIKFSWIETLAKLVSVKQLEQWVELILFQVERHILKKVGHGQLEFLSL